MRNVHLVLASVLVLAASASLCGQGAPSLWVPVTQSLDAASPEVPGQLDPSDLDVTAVPCPSPRSVPWTRQSLSVPASGNIDAFSDGTDLYPPFGGLPPGTIPGQTQILVVNFSVDRTTIGIPNTPIAGEVATDGAAGDTFLVELANGGGVAIVLSDHQCNTPLPNQSNIDALCWSQSGVYPVYYSVDVATAALMQAALPGVTEGDVIRVLAPGSSPEVFATRASLGLVAGDDIDAIAYDNDHFIIVFSLSRTSPTAIANPLVGAAGLFSSGVLGSWWPLQTWAPAQILGMNGGVAADNLDAVRILVGDPWPNVGLSMPGQGSCNGIQLTIDRPVMGYPMTMTVAEPWPTAAPGALAFSLPNAIVTPLPNGCNLYLDPATGLVFSYFVLSNGTWSMTIDVPNAPGLSGLAFELQAGVFDAMLPGGLGLSNAVTIVVGAI